MKSTAYMLVPKMGNKFRFTFKTLETALIGSYKTLSRELRSASPVDYLPKPDGALHAITFVFTDDVEEKIFNELLSFSESDCVSITMDYTNSYEEVLRTTKLVDAKVCNIKTCPLDYNGTKNPMTLHLTVEYKYGTRLDI